MLSVITSQLPLVRWIFCFMHFLRLLQFNAHQRMLLVWDLQVSRNIPSIQWTSQRLTAKGSGSGSAHHLRLFSVSHAPLLTTSNIVSGLTDHNICRLAAPTPQSIWSTYTNHVQVLCLTEPRVFLRWHTSRDTTPGRSRPPVATTVEWFDFHAKRVEPACGHCHHCWPLLDKVADYAIMALLCFYEPIPYCTHRLAPHILALPPQRFVKSFGPFYLPPAPWSV